MASSLGYRKITGLDAVKAVSSAVGGIPHGAIGVLLQAENASIRWRDDGVDPTSTDGMLLSNGESFYYDQANLYALRFIEVVPTAMLHASFYKD